MKIEIKEQKKNPLLKREELSVSLEHPKKATPSRKEMLPEIAKALGSKEELVIIDKIFSVPGKNISQARVLAYNKKDEIPPAKLEMMKRRMTKKKAEASKEGKPPEAPKEEAKSEEKPAEGEAKEERPAEEAKPEEAPAEEKPAEEKKEEPKQEEKNPKEEEKA